VDLRVDSRSPPASRFALVTPRFTVVACRSSLGPDSLTLAQALAGIDAISDRDKAVTVAR